MIKEYGYEYDASLDVSLWRKTERKITTRTIWGAICMRSGRDALKAIAREYPPMTVLMPALSCSSMILPFVMNGHTIVYYRLTNEYRIDVNYLKNLIPKEKSFFIYMDYFGIKVIDDSELENLKNKNPNLIFIEDCTHNLIWKHLGNSISDYRIASLRKWINVPDGGLLWTRIPLKIDDYTDNTSFFSMRLKAQCLKREFLFTGNQDIKKRYRKIFSSVTDIIDKDNKPSRMSEYSYNIIQKVNWNYIRYRRRENARKLISILKEAIEEFIQPEVGKSDLYVAFKTSDRDYKQQKLSSQGIFNTIIWPLSENQKKICSVAKFTEQMMMAAPCDQRYTIKDMEYIGNEMVRVFNE